MKKIVRDNLIYLFEEGSLKTSYTFEYFPKGECWVCIWDPLGQMGSDIVFSIKEFNEILRKYVDGEVVTRRPLLF